MQFQVKYPADPIGSHKAKIKSHPGALGSGLIHKGFLGVK